MRSGLILLLLGLLSKASSTGISTKVYYAELQIESFAYNNFSQLLSNITSLTVKGTKLKNITITTDCNLQTGAVSCNCSQNYRWSDEVCKNFSSCCSQTCTFNTLYPETMCLYDNRVSIQGSLTVNASFSAEYYYNTDEAYGHHVTKYTQQLESVYSSLEGFESVTITGFRQGSVIVDFLIQIVNEVDVTTLEGIVQGAANTLNGTFSITTVGLIKCITDPNWKPISYTSSVNITCKPPKNVGESKWSFQQNGKSAIEITNGTEATIVSSSEGSQLRITSASEIWKGTFTCTYYSQNSASIRHTANIDLDVALIPRITIISNPPCPSCKKGVKSPVTFTVMCMIDKTSENYTVTWLSDSQPKSQGSFISKDNIFHNVTINIFCDNHKEALTVECVFTNRVNRTENKAIVIPIIYDDSRVCPADGDWPEVKDNFMATMLCRGDTVGVKTRNCIGTWQSENNTCVNADLYSLLNDAENLKRGQGIIQNNANDIFSRLKTSTENPTLNTFTNIKTSVNVLEIMQAASTAQNSKWNDSVFPDFVKSSSNLLNDSLKNYWSDNNESTHLAVDYLRNFEAVINTSNINASNMITQSLNQENVHMNLCNQTPCNNQIFNMNVSATSNVIQTGFRNLYYNLPNYTKDNVVATITNNIILSVIPLENETKNIKVDMSFPVNRPRNTFIYCAYFDTKEKKWSEEGCIWGGPFNPYHCECNHTTPFTQLVASTPYKLPYSDMLTTIGVGMSIGSLTLGLLIECLVWNSVVKSNISHFRHTVLVNIMLSLLVAHCSFISAGFAAHNQWCLILTVVQHFCFLAMFFWTLCLCIGLLHQLIFVFVALRKKVYLGLSFFLGYVCPLIIVTATIISYTNGKYYDDDNCWLIYNKPLEGSIHSFVIPAGIIVILNMFTMAVVISRILKPTVSEGKTHDEKEAARNIVKAIVFLTPTLGLTWLLGLFAGALDLTYTPVAQIVNYSFIALNSLQGFFILFTGCLGDKRVRDALLKRFKQQSAQSKSESSARITSATKKK